MMALPRLAPLLVLAWALLLAPWTTLWDRDEPRFARETVEMIAAGRALYPTYEGDVQLHKPILLYWAMAVAARVLGPTELAFRAPSALGLAVACALAQRIAARIAGERAGLLALAVLATAPLAVLEGCAATADGLLLAALTGALAVLHEAFDEGVRRRHVVGLTAAMAVGQLAKGPVAVILPLLAAGLALWLAPGLAGRRRPVVLLLAASALISLLVFAAWAVPAELATGGRFSHDFLRVQFTSRIVRPREGHAGSVLFYLPVLLLGLGPWVLFAPRAVIGQWRSATPGVALLLAWIAVPFAVFSTVATKLPHYVLPAWPAIAIAIAIAVEREERRSRAGEALYAAGMLALLAALTLGAAVIPLAQLRAGAAIVAVLIGVGATLVLRAHAAGRVRRAAWTALGATVAVETVAAVVMAPALEAWKPVPRIAAAVREAGAGLVLYAFDEPSLHFYAAQGRALSLPDAESLQAWSRRPGRGVVVTTQAALDAAVARLGPLPLRTIAAASGVNYAKGTAVTLLALSRNEQP